MIQITEMTYRIAGRVLFENASATVPKGHKVGLIGRNGCGKSTLLKLLMGELSPDAGNITINGKLMFVYQALSSFNIWHGIEPDVNENVIKLLD